MTIRVSPNRLNQINMKNIFRFGAGKLFFFPPSLPHHPHFWSAGASKCRSICMQLCITLTRWPHLSVNLKSTFIQMCSARWRLTLHNPSKCSIWREGLELFESSESSLACGEQGAESVESLKPANKKITLQFSRNPSSQSDLVSLF